MEKKVDVPENRNPDGSSKKPESFESQFKRRVVKTTKPEHKEKGFNWRIKGKKDSSRTMKLFKKKPTYDEFVKELKRIAGWEFGVGG